MKKNYNSFLAGQLDIFKTIRWSLKKEEAHKSIIQFTSFIETEENNIELNFDFNYPDEDKNELDKYQYVQGQIEALTGILKELIILWRY